MKIDATISTPVDERNLTLADLPPGRLAYAELRSGVIGYRWHGKNDKNVVYGLSDETKGFPIVIGCCPEQYRVIRIVGDINLSLQE